MSLMVVAAVTLASYPVGWAIGSPVLMPFLNAAGAWWVMTGHLRAGRTARAVGAMLVWAAVMGATATTMSMLGWTRDGQDRSLFLRDGYRDEMLSWVRTGVGAEGTPSEFVPRHLVTAGSFAAVSTATGGVLSMPMGAVLMNSMGEYVGAMAADSPHPMTSIVLGWHPWSVVRIVGFVILGVVLSGVVLSRVMGFAFSLGAHRRWVTMAVGLLVLDVALKWILAPAWGRLLRGVAGW